MITGTKMYFVTFLPVISHRKSKALEVAKATNNISFLYV